eukprot:scpid38648/ scgid18029/ 
MYAYSAEAPTQQPAAQPANRPNPPHARQPAVVHSCIPQTPHTPINIHELETELQSHPDSHLVQSVLSDLRHGCRLGFTGNREHSAIASNLSSAHRFPSVVSEYLAKECTLLHTCGPFDQPPFLPFRTSGIGVVPKKSGGHRLILHLSAPANNSINDFINQEDRTFKMISVDNICDHVKRVGPGALLTKVDLRHAFRLIPVHPDDWPLLGMCWGGKFYFDTVLPFGLRSSPFLFNRFADLLAWILRVQYSIPYLEHYLDDYINVSLPANDIPRSTAAVHKATILQVLDNLGVPVAEGPDKVAGPATSLSVLGLEIDTVAMEIRLPAEKLRDLQERLDRWQLRASCRKRELLSLIGLLSFAAKVVAAGRTFVRRLIDLSAGDAHPDESVQLSEDAQADIQWWRDMLPSWNGRALIRDYRWSQSPDLELFTDASGHGHGGYFKGEWFTGTWAEAQTKPPRTSIIWREMFPVATACALWGPKWSGKKILLHCDNKAVGVVWKSGTCRNPAVMELIRFSLRMAAEQNFILLITHIAGTDNSIADALSRGQGARFRSLAPHANTGPCPVPNRVPGGNN